ncbi:1,2-phenylacetyl-CoA epoxidase, subunit E [bacterium HR40]|nr:1,2-phenylacetyl-CoA epoxidase, subunit E [bacterium HR40]
MARFHPLPVVEIRRETAECVSIALAVPEELKPAFRFRPGQHLVVRAVVDGAEVRRTYSLCSTPREDTLRIAVKRQPHGRFSGFANARLAVGDRLEAMPPTGRFAHTPDPGARRHYVAFAAGSGITPIFGILKAILEEEPHSRFTLFYGNRNTSSIIFREGLADLKDLYMERLALHHVLSAEVSEALELFSGRIDAEKVRAWAGRLFQVSEVDRWFVCGPAPMIQTVSDALLALGVPAERILFEYFTAEGNRPRPVLETAPRIETSGDRARITVILDGERHEFDMPFRAETVLEAARRFGLELPFSCRAGVCATCRARLVAGKVELLTNYALDERDLAAGDVLTCQARPLTAEVTLDFDRA